MVVHHLTISMMSLLLTIYSAQYLFFQQQSQNEGTYDILISCSLTMALCVWTALHLNIACDKRTLATKGRLFQLWYNGMFLPSPYYGRSVGKDWS